MRFKHKTNATTCLVFSKSVKELNKEFQTFAFSLFFIKFTRKSNVKKIGRLDQKHTYMQAH